MKHEGVSFYITKDWRDIRPVRDTLRAFAVQTILAELGREAEEAVKSENSLHTQAVVPKRKAQATADVPNSESSATHHWADIESATTAHSGKIQTSCK